MLDRPYFVSSNERWPIAPQVKRDLLASALSNYEHEVKRREHEVLRTVKHLRQTHLHLRQTQARLWALRVIRESLRSEVEKGLMQ